MYISKTQGLSAETVSPLEKEVTLVTRDRNYIPGETVSVLEKEELEPLFLLLCLLRYDSIILPIQELDET